MCPSRRGVQCIIARANATADAEAGVARSDGIPLAIVSCVQRRIRVEVAPETREFPRGERRSCIAVDSRSRQTGDPGDVPAAHGGADSRQADVLLRTPRRHGHGHRGRGATFPAFYRVPRHAGTSTIISAACYVRSIRSRKLRSKLNEGQISSSTCAFTCTNLRKGLYLLP